MNEQDYITLAPCLGHTRFIVAVMKWQKRDEQFIQARISNPLLRTAALALAHSWAFDLGLEFRE